ncbi:GNAT family N-acetyltransferase [Chitinibacter bivalviorum]|uniref:GNAT family N-acetyltransferase n=1 Tax=Chitinibacter bivalviorum TaxID=2739434 RepID=A0A7H9BIA2_9NEIS|nr:GNAT family N-acetyltransferase [Chitinibacter bivalviorum]QLG87274.1 GNAT family N-acetyltransferase [Chitinibacter bivalviorum]
MSSPQFIEINPDNIAPFCDLYLRVFNAAPWHDGWIIEAVTERLCSFGDFPRFYGLGLVIDEVPVALVLGWGERWIQSWHFQIKEMCVANELQGRGLGKMLMRELESRLLAQDYQAVFLYTGSHVPAKDFYQTLGFKLDEQDVLGKRIERASSMLA